MFQTNDFFQTINIYGLPFSLRYKKSEKYTTFSGILLTLLTFIIVIFIVILYSLDLINRTGFVIMTNFIPIKKKTLFDFSKTPFMIGFVNWERSYQSLNSSYLSLTFDRNIHNIFINEQGVYEMKRISKSIILQKCDPKIHYIGNNNFMYDFDYNKFLCVLPGQNLSVGGRFGDNINGYDILEIHLNKCENSSDNNSIICESEENIYNYINNSYLEIIYLTENTEHNNYTNPIVQYVRNELYVIAKEVTKRYYHYFTIGNYISDNGLLFKKKHLFEFFESDHTRLDFVKEEDQEYYSPNALLEVVLTCNDRKKIHSRTYVKIQDVIRNIGGFIDLIHIIFQFICSYFSKKRMLLDIINHIILEEKYEKTIAGKSSTIINNLNIDISSNNIIKKNEDNFPTRSKTLKNNPVVNNFCEIKPTKSSLVFINESYKKYFKIRLLDYLLPLKILGKFKKYNWLFFYQNLYSQYMSIEVILPIIERLTKVNLEVAKKSNYFKLSD